MYAPGPVMQPSYPAQHPAPYPYRYSQPNGVSSPNQPSVSTMSNGHMLPLPTGQLGTPNHSPLTAVHPSNSPGGPLAGKQYRDSNRPMDTTGQIAPPGAKPQVTAMLWEDEGSLCFQVEANGVCVARREDNHMINGTKLLNVAGMTRGRRDGILKSEKQRHVVKIGPMHLKGVWIPFERALDFANKEKITELLYPLFVHNISALMYHPMNSLRTNAILQAVERKRMEQQPPAGYGQPPRRNPADLVLPSSQPPPLQYGSMGSQYPMNGGMQHGGPMPKPEMGRSLSFPTPPNSGGGEPNYWNGSQNLGIDTGVGSRSMPATPATTPPGSTLNQMPQYPAQNYGEPRSATVATYSQSMQQPQLNQSMARFGGPLPQPNSYMEQGREMAPPSSHQSGSRPSSRQNEADSKDEGLPQQSGIIGEVVDEQQPVHYQSAPEHESERKDDDYGHSQAGQSVPAGYTTAPRGSYYTQEHTPHLSPDLSGSPSQQGAGTPNRGAYSTSTQPLDPQTGSTPRSATAPQQQWLQQTSAYTTSPRGTEQPLPRQPPARALYGMEGERDSQAGGYAYQGNMNGSNKRIRELDDDEDSARPASRDSDTADAMTMKRRKTLSQSSLPNINSGVFDAPINRSASLAQRRG
ncbi:apses-domain-containing protein [Ascobolus immersus RN42]|uniref:Apses-domain-containing protein n=1 Tax=Ascobolus immersus RN42 TaxID=1160509 RepID=A0A3N4I0Y3_ASCIM|nr:apses-domain-containing protein [Ascobolus immersus RN42]